MSPALPRPSWSSAALLALGVWAFAPAARAQAPGPESFAKPPKTPAELWDAVDYLVRVGQADKAAPYLKAFVASKPDDEILLRIRDEYGAGSILRLQDDPATRAQAEPLLRMLADASRRRATRPDRLQRFIAALYATKQEQDYAVDRLREAGPYAVPPILERLADRDLTPAQRAAIVDNLGRLDINAVPALVAVLDAPDSPLAADAAEALGHIGDPRALPFLVYPAARPADSIVREPARRAIARLTGTPYASLPKSPVRMLTDEARKYLTHAVGFPGDQVVLWSFRDGALEPRTAGRSEAEGFLGRKFAREALALDPADATAQTLAVALDLQKEIERTGLGGFPSKDTSGAYARAVAAGPTVLVAVLREALADGLSDLAAGAAFALGRVADRDALAHGTHPHPLVEALSAPDRRVRFAAARALVEMAPHKAFPGSSRVVPTLAQFLRNGPAPTAVVIDGDNNRANNVAATLRGLGYDTKTATTGPDGFRLAAESGDVEAIFVEPTVLLGPWKARDTLVNLRADAATAGVPILLYAPLKLQDRLARLPAEFPRVAFLVTPSSPQTLKAPLERELARMGARPLTDAERQGLGRSAAELLASVAARSGSPFEADLAAVEPALATALATEPASLAASSALADIPAVAAQRGLADTLLAPARPPALRLSAAEALARSIQRFGPLVSAEQERALVAALDGNEPDAALRAAIANVVGALRPRPSQVGRRLLAPDAR